MAAPTAPAWAALGPLEAFVGSVYAGDHDVGGFALRVAEVLDIEDRDAVADMIAAAPGWALLFRLGSLPRHTVTLDMSPNGRAVIVTRWHDGVWTDHVLPLDAHGLPVMTAAQYRALAPLVGWPVAPAATVSGEGAS